MQNTKDNIVEDLLVCGDESPVTDNMLGALFSSQKNLVKIFLKCSPALTDDVLHHIARNCVRLKDLTIYLCNDMIFAGSVVAALCSSCTRLRMFCICTRKDLTEALLQISIHRPDLEELVLWRCRKVDDKAILPVIKRCTQLKLLSLERTAVTKASFAAIALHCSALTKLHLAIRDADDSTVEGFRQLSSTLSSYWGPLPESVMLRAIPHWGQTMRHLELYVCPVSDSVVQAIARGCSNLRKLLVCDSKVQAITDQSLRALSVHTPLLQSLTVFGGESVTDQGVLALSRGCPHLRHLSLSASTVLTERSLLPLIQDCPRLEKVELYSCANKQFFRKYRKPVFWLVM